MHRSLAWPTTETSWPEWLLHQTIHLFLLCIVPRRVWCCHAWYGPVYSTINILKTNATDDHRISNKHLSSYSAEKIGNSDEDENDGTHCQWWSMSSVSRCVPSSATTYYDSPRYGVGLLMACQKKMVMLVVVV